MDKYDDAIEYLVEYPDETMDAWADVIGHKSGVLFRYCTPDGVGQFGCRPDGRVCGCLTQVKQRTSVAWTPKITAEIRRDKRIHPSPEKLQAALLATKSIKKRRAILQPYAEWQRRMDAEIRNVTK